MRTSLRNAVAVIALALALCLSSVACKRLVAPFRSPPALTIQAASEGRKVALGVGLLPDLDRSLNRIEAVAQVINIPFDVAAMRTKVLAGLKLPASASKAISMSMPIAVVLLPPAAPGKNPEATAAFQLKSADAGQEVVRAFGKPAATKDDAANFKQEDGESFWLWLKNNDLVVSTSLDALVTGAALAMEALAKPEEDLVVILRPDAIAQSQGTDLKSALAKFIKNMQAAGTAGGQSPSSPSMLAVIQLMVQAIGSKVGDVEDAQLSLHIDATRGGTISAKLKPKAGSGLGTLIAKPVPYAFEPAVLAGDEPFMLAASSPVPWLADAWRALAPALTETTGGAALAKHLEAVVAGLTGAFSAAARIHDRQWQQVAVYQLAPTVSADAYLDQLATLYKSPDLAKLFANFGLKMNPKLARDKNLLSGELKMDVGKLPPEQAMTLKSMLGDKYVFAVAAEPGRVLMATGRDARALAKGLLAPDANKTAPASNIASALDETHTSDAFVYIDLMQSLRLGLSASPMGATLGQLPAMAALNMPMWFSYRGGSEATLDWRIPMSTVRSVGSLLPLLGMLSGGAR
jgi:hypothetical protein